MTEITTYHGGKGDLHLGICLTDDADAAAAYADKNLGTVAEYVLDLSDLLIVDCDPAYTTDDGDYVAPGDDGATVDGADVLRYLDTDEAGRTHQTYRLMTPAALAALEA